MTWPLLGIMPSSPPTVPAYRHWTSPTQPVTVVTYVTPDCARQVVSANGLIYVADQFGGLYIFTLITAP